MFSVLFNFLKWLWDSLYACITFCWNSGWVFMGIVWALIGGLFGSILYALQAVFALVNWIDGQLTTTLSQIGGVSDPGTSSVLSFVNYVFPLNETFTMAALYVGVSGGLVIYRFAKSWLPKIAGFGFGS